MNDKIKVACAVVGPVSTNCYLLQNAETKEVLIIDPGARAESLKAQIRTMNGTPTAILLTHGHFDHICAVEELVREYQIPVYAMAIEKEMLADPQLNMSGMGGVSASVTGIVPLVDGQKLDLAGQKITVLYTPGHTRGGACFYIPDQNLLFSGDTLFQGSVGRTDFPGGSMTQIVNSIREKLFVLPEETDVCPGHGAATTIGYEKKYNPFL